MKTTADGSIYPGAPPALIKVFPNNTNHDDRWVIWPLRAGGILAVRKDLIPHFQVHHVRPDPQEESRHQWAGGLAGEVEADSGEVRTGQTEVSAGEGEAEQR